MLLAARRLGILFLGALAAASAFAQTATAPLVKALQEPQLREEADRTLAALQVQLDKLKAPRAP